MAFIKKNIYIIIAAVCVVAIGALYAVQINKPKDAEAVLLYDAENATDSPAASETQNGETPAGEAAGNIFVYISGEVSSPGVYELPNGSRVNDAVSLAGGFTAEADSGRVNLAAKLEDEDHITVPAVGEVMVVANSGGETSQTSEGKLININTASADELQTLPNIGETIAGYIIAYREAHGGFKSVGELINVDRIGEATYGKLKDKITID